ncbi:hypothetical protein SAMN05216315_101141 [Nitrosospira sp. Nsp18]|nr:hypothetical protein SAMN05216315_101141 [Nitrosospira sp. Nsp18]
MPGTFNQYRRHTRLSFSLTPPGRYNAVQNQTLRIAGMLTINEPIQSLPDFRAFILTAFYAFSSHYPRFPGISPCIPFTDVGAGT